MKTANNAAKRLLILIYIFLLPFLVGAKSISVDGYGNSSTEAKYNASLELNRYINGEYVSSLTEVVSSDTGKKSTDDYFSDSISIISEGELIGVEYSDAIVCRGDELKKGLFKVTATISDALSEVYLEKIKSTVKSVDAIYKQNPSTTDSKKAKLLNLLSEIKKYDNYRQVAIFLGVDSSIIGSYASPVTYQSVNTELQSLLIEEEAELSNAKKIQKDVLLIEKITEELEANRKEQDALRAQQENNSRIVQEMAMASIQERVNKVLSDNSMKNTILAVDSNIKIQGIIEDLKQSQENWNKLYLEYESLVEQEINRIDNSLSVERKALENKAYRITELSNGEPIASAKRFRELEIADLEERKIEEKAKIIELIRDGFHVRLQESFDLFLSYIKILEETDFESSTTNGQIYITSKSFDANINSWKLGLVLDTDVNGFKISLADILVSYQSLSGKNPVKQPESLSDDEAKKAFDEYSADVEFYDRILDNITKSSYNIKAKYNVKYILSQNRFQLDVDQISFEAGEKILFDWSAYGICKLIENTITAPNRPYWLDNIDSNSIDYLNIKNEYELADLKKQDEQKLAEKKAEREKIKAYIEDNLSIGLAGGLNWSGLSLSNPIIVFNLRAPIVFNLGEYFHLGLVPELQLSSHLTVAGILLEAEVHANFGDEYFDSGCSFSLGADLGFASESILFRPYIGSTFGNFTCQLELEVFASKNSETTFGAFGVSFKIEDIL